MNSQNRSRRGLWTAFVALLLLAGAPMALAQQQQGSLYGTVTDDQGAALPGVTVEVSGIGAPRLQITNAQGEFRFLGLDPGNYQLKAGLEGFSTVEYEEVNIRIGRSTTLSIELSSAVEEVITVTSESPLLDERKITSGTTVSQIELEKIPTARDPWSIVTQTPGVLSDRINVGGNESGQQAVFLGPGQDDDENTFAVDGVIITDMAAVGASPTYYDFDQFEEMQITTGGSDITSVSAGVTMNMVTKRGSNTPRGSGRYLLTDASDENFDLFKAGDPAIAPGDGDLGTGGLNANNNPQNALTGNSINEVLDFGFEGGGAFVQDRFWGWGSYGRNDIKQFAAGGDNAQPGDPDNTLLENTALKFNGQIAASNSAVGSWNRGDKLKDGRGAGPGRQTETTWDQSGPTEIWKIEDTHVFNSNFYLTGLYSYVDGGFQLIPKAGGFETGGEALLDADGIWKNGYLGGVDNRDTDNYQVDGSYFFNTGNLSHELKFGAALREFVQESNFQWGGPRLMRNIACENIGTCTGQFGTGDRLIAQRSGAPTVETEYTSAWVQDTVTLRNLTLNFGLRYDLQEGGNTAAGAIENPIFNELLPALTFDGNDAGFDWQTVSPRIGATWALGAERRTLLRASFSRFSEQLSTANISRINPVGNASATFFFDDLDGDNIWDAGEPTELVRTRGFDPTNPFSTDSPNLNDANLDPATTNELVLGVEHAFLPEFVASANFTYRQVDDVVFNTRPIFRDANGVERPVVASDYVADGSVTGTLPNGQSYSIPTFAINSSLTNTGGTLLENRDAGRTYTGVALGFTKRLANRWMARGYFNFGEAEVDNGAGFAAVDDPTNASGSFDDDGELFVVQSAGSGNKGDVIIQSTYSWNLNGMYQVAPERPWGFNVAANLFGREGYPLPYFRNVTGSDGIARAVQVVGGVDDFRADEIFTVDVRVEKDFRFSDNLSATFSLDAFNLNNERYVLQRERSLGSARADFLDETLAPRVYRLGFRINWR